MDDDTRKPDAAALVRRLETTLLHRVIERQGLEACGDLVALATPEQLARVFDIDLWRADVPGGDEQLDPGRFATWLTVIADLGDGLAATRLAAIDRELLVAGLSEHVRVLDAGVVSEFTTTDGDQMVSVQAPEDAVSIELGGYLIVARRTDAWDAIVALLPALDAGQPACFHDVMTGCRRLSNSPPEVDGLDDLLDSRPQLAHDVAAGRTGRRELRGYVAPAEARAFLTMSRQGPESHGDDSRPNPIVRSHLRAAAGAGEPLANGGLSLPTGSDPDSPADTTPEAIDAAIEVLVDAGLLQPARALLTAGSSTRRQSVRIDALMAFVRERDAEAFTARTAELGFLANALIAGCSIQGRPFTAAEASEAVVATCNLGLESLRQPQKPGYLIGHDLVSVFQIGWKRVHDDVSLYVGRELLAMLVRVQVVDRQTQAGLNTLRLALTRHLRAGAPWHARDELDVIATLDLLVWTSLLGLLGEYPVVPVAMPALLDRSTEGVSPQAFDFIADLRQIARIHDFMRDLPALLAR